MVKAYNKGTCCPYHFRKCLSSDMDFIIEFNDAMAIKNKVEQEQKDREVAINKAMANLPGGMHG